MTEQELEKLYNEAHKAVYWTALSLLKNKEEAEDVVQDTFITAFNSYDSLKDKTKAVPWVKKIAANKCLNILTRTKTFNAEDEFFENTEAVSDDFLPATLVESQEKRKIIMDIINNSLSEDSRMTIILFYFNEMSIKEIAERLNIPQGTVLSRLNYAKKKIKKEVEKYEKDNKDKLFAMGVPFLTLLFEKEAEQIPFKPMPLPLKSIAASAKAQAGTTTATTAQKAGSAIIIRNVAIGVAAALTLGGVGLFSYTKLADNNKKSKSSSKAKETYEANEVEETTRDINSKGTTPEMLNLSGGYVRYSNYHDKNGDEEKDQQYFDADGNMVLDCLYNENGEMIHSDYFIYEDGKLVREELWDYTTDQYGSYKEYTYNSYGIERIDTGYLYLNNSEVEKYYEYEYDDQGKLLKVTRYSTNSDKIFWYCDYIYNDDGTYIEQVTEFDTLSQKMKQSNAYCLYSADGTILEEKTGYLNEKYVYIYDDNGILISMEDYSGSKLDSTSTYEYDSEGRLIKEVRNRKDGTLLWEYTYTYEDL